jgi:hypothetical protein
MMTVMEAVVITGALLLRPSAVALDSDSTPRRSKRTAHSRKRGCPRSPRARPPSSGVSWSPSESPGINGGPSEARCLDSRGLGLVAMTRSDAECAIVKHRLQLTPEEDYGFWHNTRDTKSSCP